MSVLGACSTRSPRSLRRARPRRIPAQPLLLVDNLTKHFPVRGGLLNRQATVQAVDDVSFSVRKGETLGIVGESGCGKSTTARLLMHLIEPDGGSVVFDGEAVGARAGPQSRELHRQMQMVFQDSYASLNPRMTVAKTIAYAPLVHGVGQGRAAARDGAAGAVGLDPLLFATAIRTNCPAASGSASTSRARWRWSRAW